MTAIRISSALSISNWKDRARELSIYRRLSSPTVLAITNTSRLPKKETRWREAVSMLKRKAMQAVISKHGWDGEWFRRAYDAFGKPIGSKQCAEGKIFIESQGWGIILGVRPSAEGLVVDPCIPRKWKGFKVHRVFRGKTYHITVKNPDGHSKGVKKLLQRYIYP